MKKDKKWLKDEVKVFQEGENMFTAEFNAGVQDALEYVQELIDQLDEPEKPVIPKFVSEWFETNKNCLADAFAFRQKTYAKKTLDERDDIDNWFANTDYVMDVLVNMKNGYEVEEEQKYQVIIRDGEYIRLYLCKHGDNVMIGTNDNYIEKCPEVTYLTEKEIKDYDERYIPFMVPVNEVNND